MNARGLLLVPLLVAGSGCTTAVIAAHDGVARP